MAITNLVTTN